FFQAEDGIRGLTVTGVQTCALPIFRRVRRPAFDTQKPAGERAEYGPYKINDGLLRIMRTSSGGYRPTEGEHIRKSELCATCHTQIGRASCRERVSHPASNARV